MIIKYSDGKIDQVVKIDENIEKENIEKENIEKKNKKYEEQVLDGYNKS